ncbi:MAG: 30S ribosomal protein S6 [Candidatus Zhuqueibacterota bacterium]
MRTYETVVVIDSLLKSEEIDAVIEKISRIINNNGGVIKTVDHWGKKRLAYEIKKRQYGYYVEIIFDAPGNIIKTLEREYRLDENILRYLSLYLDASAIAYIEEQRNRQTKTQVEKANGPEEKPGKDVIETEILAPVEENAEVIAPSSDLKVDAE